MHCIQSLMCSKITLSKARQFSCHLTVFFPFITSSAVFSAAYNIIQDEMCILPQEVLRLQGDHAKM